VRKYYSAHNHYATDTSLGFANTWYVIAWSSTAARAACLNSCDDWASRKIRRDQIRKYTKEVKPFSGEGYRLDDSVEYSENPSNGMLGCVVVSANTNWPLI
jgi:hypothetical protein